MRRILLANFHNLGYGQPVAVFLLARALHQRGHQVVVACPKGSALAEWCQTAEMTHFTNARFLKHRHFLSMRRDVRCLHTHLTQHPPDIIHTNGSQDTWALALARRKLRTPMPIVMSRHNSKVVHTGWSNRWLYGKALDRVVLTSAAIREQYQPMLSRGILDDARFTVIHPPFDLSVFERTYDRSALHRELNLPPETPIIGIVGRLNPDKGHAILIRALPLILAKHPRLHIVFVGDGGHRESLQTLVDATGASKQLHFLGFRLDVAEITACLTASVLPTIGTDSSPTVLKEALCLGVPVVAADTGGVREVIDDGETGFVVARHDHEGLGRAILRILDYPEDSRGMAAEGSRRVRSRFSPDACAARHEVFYEEVIAVAHANGRVKS